MNRHTFLIASAGALLSLASHADEITPSHSTAHELTSALAHAEHAIIQFIDACLAHDERGLSEIVTDDMRVEYALEIPETYYAVGAASLAGECPVPSEVRLQRSSVRVYPTGNERAVFVQYELVSNTNAVLPQQQLALVELRDHRIARIVNFADPATVNVTVRRPAQQRPAAVAQRDVR